MDKSEKIFFKRAVYDLAKLIPCGRVTTYGAIAKAIGYPHHSRMVGKCMSESRLNELPAHRVVSGKKCISVKSSASMMQFLLEKEGILIKQQKIQNWNKIFWNPLSELQ
jgi:methylated-DNA-protein-cysteine methyltransferase-like protein